MKNNELGVRQTKKGCIYYCGNPFTEDVYQAMRAARAANEPPRRKYFRYLLASLIAEASERDSLQDQRG